MTVSGFNETRGYNANLQLTELVSGAGVHLKYNYAASQNNGQIVSQQGLVSGETISYGMKVKKAVLLITMIAISGLWSSNCGISRDRELVAPRGSHILLFKSTASVQHLFASRITKDWKSDAKAKDIFDKERVSKGDYEEFARKQLNADPYTGDRSAFLTEMRKQPAIIIPEGSYARVLLRSSIKCANIVYDAPSYLKVRLTSGHRSGEEGWVCDGELKHRFAPLY